MIFRIAALWLLTTAAAFAQLGQSAQVTTVGTVATCTLAAPTLAATTYTESAVSGTVVGAIAGAGLTACSGTVSIASSDTTNFPLSSATMPSNVVCGAGGCPADAGPHTFSLTATFASATNSPQGSGTLSLTGTAPPASFAGDVIGGASGYWGTWPYTAAYAAAAGKALSVVNATTTCDVVFNAAGNLDKTVAGGTCSSVGTAIATFCPTGTCTVATAYDQTGNGLDAGTGTTLQQPLLVLNAYNGHACMTYSGGINRLTVPTFTLIPQPLTDYYVAKRPSAGGQYSVVSSYADTNWSTGFDTPAATIHIYAGTTSVSQSGVTDNVLHYIGTIAQGATSRLIYDGVDNVVSGTPGTAGANRIGLGGDPSGAANLVGDLCSAGLWPTGTVGFTTGVRASLHTASQIFWGTP